MRKVTLRSLWEHKRRLISTILAVLLGVAFMSGTFILSDTLNRVFDDLFAEGTEGLDAQVQGVELFSTDFGGGETRELLDQSLVDAVAQVDGVRAAEPYVVAFGFCGVNRVLAADGDPVGATQGPPTLLESWVDNDELTAYRLTAGSAPPTADDEIALNVAAADDGEFQLGDTVRIDSQLGRQEYTLVGTFTFGTAESAAGAVSANFTLAEAQELAGCEGQVQQILVDGEPGVAPEELVERIRPVLPAEGEVITGEEAAEQTADSVQEGFAFFTYALQIFAALALLVGIFIISNTFSILVAQRTRELALLRAVGASRGQVLRSVLLEAIVIGVTSALLGLLAGIGLAYGATAFLEAIGSDLPTRTLVVSPGTIIAAFVIGAIVTVVAALIPAIKATRVPPLAAIRDVSVDRSGASRIRLVLAVGILAFGLFNLSKAWTSDGDTDALPTVGLGAVLVIVGAILLGPVLAGISVRTLGFWLPRARGVNGRLAVENASRSPKRTSATASALLIGVALVGFITVFAASAKESVASEVDRGFTADLVVQANCGFGPPSGFPPAVADTVGGVPGVAVVSPVGFAQAQLTYPDGHTADSFVTTVDPETITEVLTPRMQQGELSALEDDGILVDRQVAEDNDLVIDDMVEIVVNGGGRLPLRIQGISDDQVILGNWTMTREAFNGISLEDLDFQVFAKVAPGEDVDDVQALVEEAVAPFTSLEVLDKDGFVGDLAAQLTSLVNVIYGLLALSVIIAVIGIGNTISLSVHERTRELGLLRAVGMVRGQLRSTIRWEAVLISLLGTVVGLVLGLFLSYAMVRALEGFGLRSFAVPVGSMVFIVILAAILGVLASLLPAHRASKLDVLEAIATE
jgi:putative ABC transport system permease protein